MYMVYLKGLEILVCSSIPNEESSHVNGQLDVISFQAKAHDEELISKGRILLYVLSFIH